jgi:hypothetical protein
MPHGKESRCFVGSYRSGLEEPKCAGAKREAEATRVKAVTDAKANAGLGKCVSRPESCGEVIANFAAMREALACAGGHVAALELVLEREGLVAAAALGPACAARAALVTKPLIPLAV